MYTSSGLSEYVVEQGSRPDNHTVVPSNGFPLQWNPRYAIAPGFGAHPDIRESYATELNGPRVPAVNATAAGDVSNGRGFVR